MNENYFDKNTVFGVIGICGITGNLIARILKDRGFKVIGSDMANENDCKFKDSLKDYDIPIYYKAHPEEFFNKIDYLIPPASLNKNADIFKIIESKKIPILELDDILTIFKPDKPVFGITGTNGKTTTVSLVKKISNDYGIKTSEHGLNNMQGNAGIIPPLQARMKGDVAILEIGTFGEKGSIKNNVEKSKLDGGIVTNISPDHLNEKENFLDYARVKGEFIEYLKNKTLIINSQDPTIKGLIKELKYEGTLISFAIDGYPVKVSEKPCFCGKKIDVKEIIPGCGYYLCPCGIVTEEADYVASKIDLENKQFTLYTPEESLEVKMTIDGIHNVYNIVGAIIFAHEFLKIPYESILKSVANFKGVPGRMEKIAKINGKEIIIDFAHNPAGVETVLREFKKIYDNITTVITISSESGEEGDEEIFEIVNELSDYIVPASHASQNIAIKKIKENPNIKNKILLSQSKSDFIKKGTIGATADEVIDGVKNSLKLNPNTIICIGEAAVKFKGSLKNI